MEHEPKLRRGFRLAALLRRMLTRLDLATAVMGLTLGLVLGHLALMLPGELQRGQAHAAPAAVYDCPPAPGAAAAPCRPR